MSSSQITQHSNLQQSPLSPAVAELRLVRCMATRTAATVFLLIALAACDKWSDKRVTESVEQAIRQLDNERIQAQIHADATALDRIYAADFIGIGPSGTVRTKRSEEHTSELQS